VTARLGPRHWAALDYAAGAIVAVILVATIGHSLRQAFPAPFRSHYFPLPPDRLLGLGLAAVAGVAVALRRRHPVLMLGVLLADSLVVTALVGPHARSLVFFLPVAYVLYLVAASYEHRRDAARVLAAVSFTLLADSVLMLGSAGFSSVGTPILIALCVIIVWTAGYTVRQRRRYAVRLQDEAASKAVAQERLRIARELHDVVAHSMSVIAVQAGYGQYVIDTQPGDAHAALGAIQATSHEALDEMRRMLGALRQADETDAPAGPRGRATGALAARASAPLFPAPGLGELDRLVARTAGAGVQVEVRRAGRPRDLPASIDLSAYRVVQEALTNVVKHAHTNSCRVLIGYGDDQLTIEVVDNGAGLPVPELAGAGVSRHGAAARNGNAVVAPGRGGAPGGRDSVIGGGHGIIGMRERVTLLGGDFSAGPLPGYGFRVSASIPLPPAGP
jgi:signal transduction histidine kinase